MCHLLKTGRIADPVTIFSVINDAMRLEMRRLLHQPGHLLAHRLFGNLRVARAQSFDDSILAVRQVDELVMLLARR